MNPMDPGAAKKKVLEEIMLGAKTGMAGSMKDKFSGKPAPEEAPAPTEGTPDTPMDLEGGESAPEPADPLAGLDMSALPPELASLDPETLKALLMQLLGGGASKAPTASSVPGTAEV